MDSQSPLTILISKLPGVGVSRAAVANIFSLPVSQDARLAYAVQQPYFFVRGISAPHAIENHQHVIAWCVHHLACEMLHLGRMIGARGVAARVVIHARLIVGRLHMSGVPEV